MSLDRKILTVINPTLPIEQMDMANTEDERIPLQSDTNKHKVAGALYPLIQINRHQFDAQEVSSLVLDETGFTPTIRVVVEPTDGIFVSKHFPKDGDPLSLWIRSKQDEFKPIRTDFEITSVRALPSMSDTGDVQRFTIEGTLRIPGLYADWCKCFGNRGSMDTLLEVAKELKAGFATNETSTNDTMKWICPYDSYDKFIKDITASSYKDDDSFFTSFFDHYYNLNFINLNNQFSEEFEVEKALETLTFDDDYFKGKELNKLSMDLFLCNYRTLRGTGNYIQGYTLLNDAGQLVIDNGYRRFVQYYDSDSNEQPIDKYKSYFIEPLDTKDTNDRILLKGRTNEDFYKKFNKYKWMGVKYGLPDGNMHDNYMHAVVQNWQNQQQIDKMKMRLYLGKCNFNLYRGQRVPVLIINNADAARQKSTLLPEQSTNEQLSYDKFLTGYYVISGMMYTWSSDNPLFQQELFLSRREWQIPTP